MTRFALCVRIALRVSMRLWEGDDIDIDAVIVKHLKERS